MRALKIALLSYEYPPETGFGGIGTYTWYHARALVRLGHEVHVIAGGTNPSRSLSGNDEEGVVVWRYPARETWIGSRLGRWRLSWSRNRWENGHAMAAALREVERDRAFDVVEMPECGAEGLFLDAGEHTAKVVKLHSPAELIMGFYPVRKLDRLLCAFLERRALVRAQAVISGSCFLAREARSALGLSRTIQVVANGIDPALFREVSAGTARERHGIPGDQRIVLLPGRLEHRKGTHLLPEIMAPILKKKPVALVLAGRDLFGLGEEAVLPALNRSSFRGSVHLLGSVSPGELRSLLVDAEVVLLPSLWENCPYACLEAMAAGRPVAAFAAGGIPELIRSGGNGLLAQPGDVGALGRAVDRLLDDPLLGERLGSEARATIEERFSALEIARQTVEVYREVGS